MSDPRHATTFLFVPGDRPERFDRAATSGADAIIIDLEDGVRPSERPAARGHARSWLRSGAAAVVRINPRGSADYALDIAALHGLATGVMLPKTESAQDVEGAAQAIGDDVAVVALVETARGVAAADDIATANAVVRLAFGNVDLATELGVEPDDHRALLTARSILVLASAARGLPGPIDGVTTEIHDGGLARDDAAHAASLGFRGKLCIHPRQLAGARSGLAPTMRQVAWARKVLADASQGEARAVEGAMVDRPVEERARDILRRVHP